MRIRVFLLGPPNLRPVPMSHKEAGSLDQISEPSQALFDPDPGELAAIRAEVTIANEICDRARAMQGHGNPEDRNTGGEQALARGPHPASSLNHHRAQPNRAAGPAAGRGPLLVQGSGAPLLETESLRDRPTT